MDGGKMKLFWQTFKDCKMQWFDDRKTKPEYGWPKELLSNFIPSNHCWFSEIGKNPELWESRNKSGWGLFIQPNPCKPGSVTRTEKDVSSIEWVYADIDGKPKDWQMDRIKKSPIHPDIIVESNSSYHIYWKCHCENRDQFDKIINGLRVFFEADLAISSINEVLRIPGFLHNKFYGKPYLIRVEHIQIVGTTPDSMISAFPYTEPIKPEPKVKSATTDSKLDEDIEIRMIKEIPIRTVLDSLGVRYTNDGFIMEGDDKTSAHIVDNGNYVKRFSEKEGSGSTIDVTMVWGNMQLKDAIVYLKKLGGIDSRVVVRRIVEEAKKKPRILDRFENPIPKNNKTWGVISLDRVFKKPKSSEYVLFLGEAGKGKTTFCLHMAIQNAKAGNKVLFLSLEMTRQSIEDRYVELWAGISEYDRENAIYTKEQRVKMNEAACELENDNLTILDMDNIKDIHNFELLTKYMDGFNIVFIDNFSRITLRGQNEITMQSMTSEMIDEYVKATGTTIVMLHHYAKSSGKERGLEARGSMKLIDDCTVHASIHVDDIDRSEVKFKIIKSRYNPEGDLKIKFNKGKYEEQRSNDPIADYNKIFNS